MQKIQNQHRPTRRLAAVAVVSGLLLAGGLTACGSDDDGNLDDDVDTPVDSVMDDITTDVPLTTDG